MSPRNRDLDSHGAVRASTRARRRAALAASTVAVAVAILIAALFVVSDGDRAATRSNRLQTAPGQQAGEPGTDHASPGPVDAVVTVSSRHATRVPRSYLGLSTEYWALPVYERHLTVLERVISLLHARGNGPFVLRIGGDSADHAVWEPHARRTPRWAYAITPAWLRRTSRLVRRAGLRLILDLNLITGSPRASSRWAAAAERWLPRRSIIGFEVGNEPDVYSRLNWLGAVTGDAAPVDVSFLPPGLTTEQYVRDFRTYRRALARVGSTAPLAGPVLANPVRGMSWISTLIDHSRSGLGLVTAHRYLYSACLPRRSPSYPTIARLLSEDATARMARRLAPAVRATHRAGLAFRLTELNSVSCRGVRGVSNSFVTALWAPDALFELLRAGVNGVNVHVRTDAVNAAFTVGREGVSAAPLLYGLMLFAQTLSPSPELVRLRLEAPATARLKAWAVRVRGHRLHVLLINKGSDAVRVWLRLPGRRRASIERLLAPSPSSRSGVTLGGQYLGTDARWHGSRTIQWARHSRRGYPVGVPMYSAALVSVRL